MIALEVTSTGQAILVVLGVMGALGAAVGKTWRLVRKAIRWGQRIEIAVLKTEQQTNGVIAREFAEVKALLSSLSDRLEAVERRQKEQP